MGKTIVYFEDLIIWQEARKLVNNIYSHTSKLSDFGFNDQIQRASISIMNNIAEGFESNGRVMFKKFLNIAKGSSGEVRSMLYIAMDLKYIEKDEAEILISSCQQLSVKINKLIAYLKTNKNSSAD